MSDLFASESAERLPLAGGELYLWHKVSLGVEDSELLERLIEATPWQQEKVVVWGKAHKQPRLVSWFGDDDKAYTYSGITLQANPWTPLLASVRASVEKLSNHSYNSALLNYYRDGRDGMGFHSDDEKELGPEPVIASLSLGATRIFVMKHRRRGTASDVKIPLESGSLLLMKGATQTNWKHGIPKESGACGPRVNLTFRNIVA